LGELGDIARGDQAGAQMRGIAEMTALYYRTLHEGGVPDELAESLTATWHFMFWRSSFWPKAGPPDEGCD
jgi:hypothetical protein